MLVCKHNCHWGYFLPNHTQISTATKSFATINHDNQYFRVADLWDTFYNVQPHATDDEQCYVLIYLWVFFIAYKFA